MKSVKESVNHEPDEFVVKISSNWFLQNRGKGSTKAEWQAVLIDYKSLYNGLVTELNYYMRSVTITDNPTLTQEVDKTRANVGQDFLKRKLRDLELEIGKIPRFRWCTNIVRESRIRYGGDFETYFSLLVYEWHQRFLKLFILFRMELRLIFLIVYFLQSRSDQTNRKTLNFACVWWSNVK